MKKVLYPLILLLLLPAFSVYSQSAETLCTELVIELTNRFQEANPDTVIKPNVALLPVQNQSPRARQYEVGPALRSILQSLMERSMLFNLVDTGLRDKIMEEMRLSLAGIGDDQSLRPGELELVQYFLEGSVTELGEDFRLTLQLISVESGEVVHVAQGVIPRDELIQTSEEFSAAYVSPYGLGIEFAMLPWAATFGKTAEIEGQPHPDEYAMFSILLHYRIRKWLVAWGGMQLAPGALRFTESYSEDGSLSYSETEMQNLTDPTAPAGDYSYVKHRSPYFSLHLGAGYVWNITKELNLTTGLDLSMAQTFLVQDYNMPSSTPGEMTSHIITSNDISLWTLAPTLKVQYYITPRLAVNLAYKFKYQLPVGDASPSTYHYQDGQYGPGSPIPQMYGLDPSLDPEGRRHYTDLSGHTVMIGMGFYF